MSDRPEDGAEHAALVAQGWKRRAQSGFIAMAGPLWTKFEDGQRVFGMLTGAAHANPAGLVHGGVLTTLADHAVSLCAWEASGRVPCVTVQLDTHFLLPVVPGAFVEARPTLIRGGKSLSFVRAVLSVQDAEVATATAVIKTTRA